MITIDRLKYTTSYFKILTVILLMFFASMIFGGGSTEDVYEEIESSKGTHASVEQWLQAQNLIEYKEHFAKAGIYFDVISQGLIAPARK